MHVGGGWGGLEPLLTLSPECPRLLETALPFGFPIIRFFEKDQLSVRGKLRHDLQEGPDVVGGHVAVTWARVSKRAVPQRPQASAMDS
jgi:hypothetical protein